jgi:hypothetical protein
MADTKQILLTGVPYTAQVQTPVVVRNDTTSGISSSTTNTTYTTQVTTSNTIGSDSTSEVTTNLTTETPILGQVNDVAIEFIAKNLGEDSVPDPRLFKFLSDEFGYSEQTLFEVYKSLTDLITTQEQVRSLLEKVLAEITTSSDVFSRVWTAFRTQTDSTTNQDLAIQIFEKVLADSTTTSDSFDRVWTAFTAYTDSTTNQDLAIQTFAKVLADSTTTSDSFDRVWTAFTSYTDSTTSSELLQQSFEKVLSDLTNAPDLLTTEVGKYLTDITALANLSYAVILVGKTLEDQTIGFSDVLSRVVDFNRSLDDTVFTTDDFYGEANIDDDEYADVYKILLEWISPQETFAVDVTKPDLVDVATSQEQIYNNPQIVKSSQTSNSDLQTSSIEPVKIDQTTTSEQKSFDVTKPDREDTANPQDQASLEPSIVQSDSTANSDLVSTAWTAYRDYLDSTSNYEQTQFEFEKVLADIGVTLDEFTRAWTAYREYSDSTTNYDLLQADFTKTLQELLAVQDELTLAPSKGIEDTAITQEQQSFDVEQTSNDQATTIDTPALSVDKKAEDDTTSISELLLTKLIEIAVNEIDYFLEDYTFDITDYTFKAVHTSDQITNITAEKVIEDLVDATDDFYGAANIDDDQIATVDKVIVDYAGFYETFDRLVDYIRLFTEITIAQDLVELTSNKVALDQTTNQEQTNFDTSKITNEQTTTSEVKSFSVEQTSNDQATSLDEIANSVSTDRFEQVTNTDDFSRFYEAVRVFTDLTQTTEQVIQLIELAKTEQSTFTELVTQTVTKLVLDQATNQEQQTFDFYAVYEELVDVTDDFYGITNVDDDQIATVDKVLADYATNSETITTVAEFYRTFLEIAATTDSITLDFAKSVVETIATSETFAIDFSTQRTEIAAISETIQQDFSTSRTETIQQSDLFTQSIEPAKYETITTSEATVIDLNLQKLETANTSETVAQDFSTSRTETASIQETYSSQWDAYKSFTETITQTDQTLLSTDKPVTEIITTSEASVLDINKQQLETVVSTETINKNVSTEFSDLVDATDDFYGEANIDDDQVASIDKVVSDYATNSDVFETLVNYLRTFSELQSLSDFTIAVIEKNPIDVTITSEQQQFDTSKTTQDSLTSTDTPAISFSTDRTDSLTGTTDTFTSQWDANRLQAETTNTAEELNLDSNKTVTETTTTTELLQKTASTQYLETVSTAEVFVKDATVAIEDLVDATDDFYGNANIDDDQIATVDKVVSDYATNLDVFETLVSYLRSFNESQYTTDLATLDTNKAVIETTNTAEEKLFDITNQQTETVASTEQKQITFSTSFNDSLTGTTDSVTTQFDANRSILETITQTDQFYLTTDKSVTEVTTTSETQTLDTSKQQLDSATIAETNNKDITTQFSDLVDATDDFYGAATVGDDEFATFDKVLADYATNAETVTTLTNFLRSVNESQILSEVFAAATDKALSDINNSSDTVTLLATSSKSESVATSQTISLTLQSYFSQDYVELGYTGETYTY